MAQEVTVRLTDDLDASEAAETVSFGLDGALFDIDLSAKNAAALRKALARFVAVARKAPGPRRPVARTGKRGGPDAAVDAKAVRAWAAKRKIELSSRGRIPATVLEQYKASTSR
jgi:hypothetical protein